MRSLRPAGLRSPLPPLGPPGRSVSPVNNASPPPPPPGVPEATPGPVPNSSKTASSPYRLLMSPLYGRGNGELNDVSKATGSKEGLNSSPRRRDLWSPSSSPREAQAPVARVSATQRTFKQSSYPGPNPGQSEVARLPESPRALGSPKTSLERLFSSPWRTLGPRREAAAGPIRIAKSGTGPRRGRRLLRGVRGQVSAPPPTGRGASVLCLVKFAVENLGSLFTRKGVLKLGSVRQRSVGRGTKFLSAATVWGFTRGEGLPGDWWGTLETAASDCF